MARWENEDVAGMNIPDPEKIETKFIDLNGKDASQNRAVAKKVESSSGSTTFYIKYGRNELLDPHNADSSYASSRRQSHMYKFKKVSQKTFESYTKYLESKNRLYLPKLEDF